MKSSFAVQHGVTKREQTLRFFVFTIFKFCFRERTEVLEALVDGMGSIPGWRWDVTDLMVPRWPQPQKGVMSLLLTVHRAALCILPSLPFEHLFHHRCHLFFQILLFNLKRMKRIPLKSVWQVKWQANEKTQRKKEFYCGWQLVKSCYVTQSSGLKSHKRWQAGSKQFSNCSQQSWLALKETVL